MEIPIPSGLHSEWAILIFIVILSGISIARMVYAWKRDQKSRFTMQEMNRYLKVLSERYTEEISDRQMNTIIDNSIEQLKLRISADVIKIMIYNNIDENPNIKNKVLSHVKNAFEFTQLHLSMFDYKAIPLSDYFPCKYEPHVAKHITDIVLKKRGTHREGIEHISLLIGYMLTKFQKMKQEIYHEIYLKDD